MGNTSRPKLPLTEDEIEIAETEYHKHRMACWRVGVDPTPKPLFMYQYFTDGPRRLLSRPWSREEIRDVECATRYRQYDTPIKGEQ